MISCNSSTGIVITLRPGVAVAPAPRIINPKINRHIFFEKHKKYDGYKLLDPDYDMAVAWKRLVSGKYYPRDITLLRHELLESEVEKRYNLTIADAHRMAKSKYN